MKRTLISFLLAILVSGAFAQADTTVPKPKSAPLTSYFSGTLSYLTNSVYNGRKDSLTTPYLTPMLGYYDKSGFFVDGSLSYLTRSGSGRIDLFSLEAGYDFYIGSFDGEVSANKSFYSSQSTNVKSEIKGSLFASGGYDFVYIKPTVEAGIDFGTKSDYLLAFGLEHTFYAANDKFQITPTIKGNGSTQNYYGSYYNKRKLGGKKKNAGITYDVTAQVEDASKYKMLDYEFSLPLSYTIKKVTLSLLPVFVVPVNPALVTTSVTTETTGVTRTKTAAEVITNTFYCSFGISYKF